MNADNSLLKQTAKCICKTACTVLTIMMCSCSGSLSEQGWRDHGYASRMGYEGGEAIASPYGGHLSFPFALSEEYVQSNNQHRYMDELCYHKERFPANSGKYEQKIQKFKEKMEQQREERNLHRMNFLKKFYGDLNNEDATKLSRKYRKYCADALYKPMMEYAKKHFDNKSNGLWSMFNTAKEQTGASSTFTHLKYSDWHNLPKGYVEFMFGDSTCIKKDNIPYCDMDQKWYKVQTGNEYVMVRLEGLGKIVWMSGLINPQKRIAIKE